MKSHEEIQQAILETTDNIRETFSDGYHTFRELYEVRMLLNALLFNEWDKIPELHVHKSKRHSDGELCFGGGWFVVFALLPAGQITFHYELKYWNWFDIDAKEKVAHPYDGHSTKDVINRMNSYLSTCTDGN